MTYFEVSWDDVNEQISLFSKLKLNKDVVTGTDELAIELLNLSDSDVSLTEFIETPKNLNVWYSTNFKLKKRYLSWVSPGG